MENRLIPAFKVQHPGKKMILIMDNAKYHHARGKDWFTPAHHVARRLHAVPPQGGRCEEDHQCVAAGEGENARVLRRHLLVAARWSSYVADARSHRRLSDVAPGAQRGGADAAGQVNDGYCIYTPPYESWLQPIEMVWARVKHKVRMQSHRQRKGPELQKQTKTALRAMDKDALTAIIGHVHRDIDEWLQSDDSGWLGYGNPSTCCGAQVRRRGKRSATPPMVYPPPSPLLLLHRRHRPSLLLRQLGVDRRQRSKKRAQGSWREQRRLYLSMTYLVRTVTA